MWRLLNGMWYLFAPETEGSGGEADEGDDAGDDTDQDEGDDQTDDEGDDSADDENQDEGDDQTDDEGEQDTDGNSKTRHESRNARQARENRELREKLARTEAERDTYRNVGSKSSGDADEQKRIRAEKIALMSPEEKQLFEANERIAGVENKVLAMNVLLSDTQDRNAWENYCLANSSASKYKDRVEERLANMRQQGLTAPRRNIYRYLIGEEVDNKANSSAGKKKLQQKKEQAGERVRQAKGKPVSARGDAGGSSKGGESLEQMRQRLLDREARGDMN